MSVIFSHIVDVTVHGSLSGSWDMMILMMTKTKKIQIARSRNTYKV